MPMHEYHPRTDPEHDPILFDNCERCAQHAETLYDLDKSFIEKLWWRMIQVETDVGGSKSYRSQNEQKACKKLFTFYLLVERFGTINPYYLFVGEPK